VADDFHPGAHDKADKTFWGEFLSWDCSF